MTVCPCCGEKFEGDLLAGCPACGAQAVGGPLAQPEFMLPSYGRAALVGAAGAILCLTLLAGTIAALLKNSPLKFDFWTIVAAGETAAWSLKWLALPALLIALWSGVRLNATIRRSPLRFAGARFAHGGLIASAFVGVLIIGLIGATVPERLRQHQRGVDAGIEAYGNTFVRAQLEYRARFGRVPESLADLQNSIPDTDGSLAAALKGLDSTAYKPSADLASVPLKSKSRSLRGSALRKASMSNTGDDLPGEGLSFTNYELRLPGEDQKLNTDDDWFVRDGVVVKPTVATSQTAPAVSSGIPNSH